MYVCIRRFSNNPAVYLCTSPRVGMLCCKRYVNTNGLAYHKVYMVMMTRWTALSVIDYMAYGIIVSLFMGEIKPVCTTYLHSNMPDNRVAMYTPFLPSGKHRTSQPARSRTLSDAVAVRPDAPFFSQSEWIPFRVFLFTSPHPQFGTLID